MFGDKREAIIERFDANDDGTLDEQEKRAAKQAFASKKQGGRRFGK